MALVKYGAGIIQVSGSIAGDTHARNRFGNYIRPRTKPINPRSSRQMGARLLVMILAEQWREEPMTSEIREAWQTYATSVTWNNRLGENVVLTGFNAFIQCNVALMTAGGDMITAAPAALGLPAGGEDFAVAGSATDKKLVITFDNTEAWATETGGFLSIQMGRPQSASHNFFGGPYRYAGSIPGDDAVPPESGAELDPPFTLVVGQKVWCRARVIRADARASSLFGAVPFVVTV